MFKIKKDIGYILLKTLESLDSLNYAEQFLDIFPDFFARQLPVSALTLFLVNAERTDFVPYFQQRHRNIALNPLNWNSNLVTYLKNSGKLLTLKDEKPSRVRFLSKTNPDLFSSLKMDVVIPLLSLKKMYGFVVIEANQRTYKELTWINDLFKIVANILLPLIQCERIQVENNRNYYKIYRMDRLAMVGELAASAAHEIKNPLAGISTFLRYFTDLEGFKKEDIIDELTIMRESVQRIDEIVKSILSYSRYKKKKIGKLHLDEIIDASLQSIGLKKPSHIKIIKKVEKNLAVETDFQQFQQVLINILFNAIEALGSRDGEIVIRSYVSGADQLPSSEWFNISIKDNGPGIPESFKEKLFQPFQTTKDEGSGL